LQAENPGAMLNDSFSLVDLHEKRREFTGGQAGKWRAVRDQCRVVGWRPENRVWCAGRELLIFQKAFCFVFGLSKMKTSLVREKPMDNGKRTLSRGNRH